MTTLPFLSPQRAVERWGGIALAIASVVLPALPLGPLFTQPPFPLAVLWAAYGWAANGAPGWGAPAALATLGLLHDQFGGGPHGLYPLLYLSAFLIARIAVNVMSARSLVSLWGGFIATCVGTTLIAALVAPLATGAHTRVWTFAEAAAITALLFPLVRPLYLQVAR